MNETELNQKAHDLVKKFFKNDYGEPFSMTEGQTKLFRAIYEKQCPRTQFECYTQYGKSDVVSMAVLLRAATFQEKWIILGASKDKAGIIMGKLIKHIFENDYTLGKFQVGEDESLDFIRRNRSKDHLTFKVSENAIGEVITLSADARRKGDDAGDILIGHGGQNLIEDDAALIPDRIHGKALRMLGGHPGKNFLLKITNSFGRSHAYRSRNDPTYAVHVIDYTQGLKEGRLTEEYVTEMKAALDPVMFGILYECKYPPSDMVDDDGWMQLLTEEHVKAAQDRASAIQSVGQKRLGCDIGEGVNFNTEVIRTDNVAKIHKKNLEPDLMKVADGIKNTMRDERIPASMTFIDAIGRGSGAVSRLHQMELKVNGVKVGEKATEKTPAELAADPIEFFNLRAQYYWKLKMWLQTIGSLEPSPDWMQLTKIYYKEESGKKIKIMSKEMMHAKGLLSMTESTDIPDALSLTFAEGKKVFIQNVASAPAKPYYPDIDGMGATTNSFDDAVKSFGSASPVAQFPL